MYPNSSRLGSSRASDRKSRRAIGVRTGLANMPNTSMTLCSECLIGMERRWLSRLHGDELIERLAGLTD